MLLRRDRDTKEPQDLLALLTPLTSLLFLLRVRLCRLQPPEPAPLDDAVRSGHARGLGGVSHGLELLPMCLEREFSCQSLGETGMKYHGLKMIMAPGRKVITIIASSAHLSIPVQY